MSDIKYNLGCGDDVRDGYINVDLRERDGVIQADITDTRALVAEHERADEVLMLDVLEHISWREADEVLRLWCRQLRPGGRIHVQVPNVARFARHLIQGKRVLNKIRSDIFGGQQYPENTHRTLFTRDRLQEIMRSVGLRVIRAEEGRNITVVGQNVEDPQ